MHIDKKPGKGILSLPTFIAKKFLVVSDQTIANRSNFDRNFIATRRVEEVGGC